MTRRRRRKEEITEEERRAKRGHTPAGANYERDCTLRRESSVQASGESRWNASVRVWLASQANVYNGQTRRSSRDLTLAVSHFRLEAAGEDSGRIKQKLGKQKVTGAASKQPSTRFADLSRLHLVRSHVGVRRDGPHGEKSGWQDRKCEKQQQRQQQRQQRKRRRRRRAQHTFNYSFCGGQCAHLY